MKYVGSKARIAKDLLKIILKDKKENQWYVEPFVGGSNVIDKVDGNRLASDNNEYLIELYCKLQKGFIPPDFITREEFNDIRANKNNYSKEIVALAGILASYNGNWFRSYGGYFESKITKSSSRNYYKEGVKSLLKQVPSLIGINYQYCEYFDLNIPNNSIIYCDPPYEISGVLYKSTSFDHEKFWNWVIEKTKEGHSVFVSSFKAPKEFTCIYEKKLLKTHPTQKQNSIEKLFIYQ